MDLIAQMIYYQESSYRILESIYIASIETPFLFTPKLFCFSFSITVHQEIMPSRDPMGRIDIEVVAVDTRGRQRGGMITMDQGQLGWSRGAGGAVCCSP